MNPVDYARQELSKNPSIPSLTLAKILFKKYPKSFASIERARSSIRYARGQNGETMRKTVYDVELLDQRKSDYSILKSYKRDHSPHEIKGYGRIGIISDVHIPYHDEDALACALEWLDKEGVDHIILNGDVIDFYQLSNFIRDPNQRSFIEELDMLRQFLANLAKDFSGVKITYKLGNHEERLDTYLCNKAPELYGLPELTIKQLAKCDELGIDVISDKRVIKLGHLSVIHGHELKGGMVSPVSPARTFVLRTKTNVLGSHHHQTSEQNDRKLNGDLLSGFSIGCLCDLHPHYMPVNNHNHGGAIVEIDVDDFYVRNRRILNGRLL